MASGNLCEFSSDRFSCLCGTGNRPSGESEEKGQGVGGSRREGEV